MLIRSNAPVFGANSNPYQQPGEWQVSVSTRNLVSNDHYNGKEEQIQRQAVGSYVTNKQNLLDIGVSRVMTKRLSLSLGVPFVNSVWASRDPISPFPGPRKEIGQNGRGLGDVSLTSRYWIFDPASHLNWNVTAGLGVKAPTGNARYQDTFPGTNNAPNQLRYVDQSVQPGDGGWGLMFETHAFKIVRRAVVFGSASYLANPRNTNGTPSLTVARGGTPRPDQWDRLVNSVPDQYLARLGGTVRVWKGLSASAAWRMEGLKRYDLIGKSNGFRRPGTAMFVEPGIAYSSGKHTVTFNVPLGYFYNRYPDPNTGNRGDATFPRHIFLSSYSLRIGKLAGAPARATVLPPAPATPPRQPEGGAGTPQGGSPEAPPPPPQSSSSTGNLFLPVCFDTSALN